MFRIALAITLSLALTLTGCAMSIPTAKYDNEPLKVCSAEVVDQRPMKENVKISMGISHGEFNPALADTLRDRMCRAGRTEKAEIVDASCISKVNIFTSDIVLGTINIRVNGRMIETTGQMAMGMTLWPACGASLGEAMDKAVNQF